MAADLEKNGVDLQTNVVIGRTLTIDDLLCDGFDAVFIGSGAGLPRFMGIPGESANGVYSANEFLSRANLSGAYLEHSSTPIMRGGRVVVVGGGNVAMDAARVALRLGAESVSVVYRRSREELPARREEVEHAIEEGVEFLFLTNPTQILTHENPSDPCDPSNGFVKAIRLVRMELGAPDESGRRSPAEISGSEFLLPCDTVIISIGTTPNPLLRQTTDGLEVNRRGALVVDEQSCQTTRQGVYAGGDAVTGAATVISAMGAGKRAAAAIHAYLQSL